MHKKSVFSYNLNPSKPYCLVLFGQIAFKILYLKESRAEMENFDVKFLKIKVIIRQCIIFVLNQ